MRLLSRVFSYPTSRAPGLPIRVYFPNSQETKYNVKTWSYDQISILTSFVPKFLFLILRSKRLRLKNPSTESCVLVFGAFAPIFVFISSIFLLQKQKKWNPRVACSYLQYRTGDRNKIRSQNPRLIWVCSSIQIWQSYVPFESWRVVLSEKGPEV